ncbi:methylcytosine dioxygenase TET3 isoform 1-T2 [Synchiropus picturatus]
MEIGSHDRLQEGMLSLELASGGNQYPNNDRPSTESEQETSRSMPRERWVLGPDKVCDAQQQACWNNGASLAEPDHHADTKDVNNLVAFSNIAGSLPPSTPSTCHRMQPNTTQLYEKFTQEMGADGAESKRSVVSQHPEDLNTLQTALSQAKHGNKPPNCDCEGPDCPDYLEWLEKKIKLANREEPGAAKTVDAPQQLHAHLPQQTEHHHLVNGSHQLPAQFPHQQHIHQSIDKVPCSKPPIPCSPQVLSIAKEKNVSLQTAIAIEALTQLSGTGPQSAGSSPYMHQKIASQTPSRNGFIPSSPGTCTSSSRSQSVPPGLNTGQQTSFEYHRPQSQGQPLPCSTSPVPGNGQRQDFGSNPQQWQQVSGKGSEYLNAWMAAKSNYTSASPSDPMSELKQLLGDNSGKFSNFKLPLSQHVTHNGGFQERVSPALVRVKQEPETGDGFHHSAPGHYNKGNGQDQHFYGNSLTPGQTAISHSTQAALQQHLSYKRNLFSNHLPGFGTPGACAPVACQNLKKWWPQMENVDLPPMAIKQEPKEPKKKRSTQASPSAKAISGLLAGPVLPKPKQIVIKKTKQRASMPTFLPQSQISIQKPPVSMMSRATALTGLQESPLPLHGNFPQAAAAGLPTQTQSQVFISTPSATPSYNTTAQLENTSLHVGALPAPHTKSEAASSLASGNTNTTPTSLSTSSTSQLQSLMSIDPKYEDLIRQFEAEFGESPGETHVSQPLETNAAPQMSNPSQSGTQDLSLSKSTTCPGSASSASSVSAEPNKEVTQSTAGFSQVSTETPLVEHPNPQPSDSLETTRAKGQLSSLDATFSMPCSPLPKRMKLEASGDIAVLSTTCYSEEDTPTKESFPSSPSLKGFLESPLRYLDSPTKSLLDTPSKDLQAEFPTCTCVDQILEKDEGPYYNHLGSGPTVASIRNLMETRYGEKGEAVRIEKVVYTGREGKSSRGCPIAKWVIRRGSEAEKLLCLVRHRAGHHCENAVIIILIMAWEGVPKLLADKLYRELSDTLTKYGNPTSRRCGLNDDRTCACQGKDPDTCGASFSFGCSWSMYFNGCKYARSKLPRKFRLQGERPEEEEKLRDNFQHLATEVAPLYKRLAPQAYSNQCLSEAKAPDCRLGLKEGRPFSGVTACMDFCAHAHKDQHNLYNGCTVVCTLTKEDNRKVGEIPPDEQLHVLPLYKVSLTDEFGSEEAQRQKMQTGAIQVLQAFRREVRKLPEPAKSCRQRRLDAKKAASEKKKSKLLQQSGQTPDKTVVKTELSVSSSPQPQGNKAIIKQEVKPSIKKEPYNGSIDEFNVHPHPAYYARGGLPPTGQPPAADPVNGYHHNLPPMHYNHYNYPPNALFPSKMRTYEGRHGSLNKVGAKPFPVDRKPDVHSLQARLAQSYPEQMAPGVDAQAPDYSHSRPSSVSSEPGNRSTPIIKQEPMDVAVYEGTVPSRSGASTPSTTPQPAPWPQQTFSSGGIVPPSWDHPPNPKQSTEGPSLNVDRPQSHQHRQPSPYPQPWTSLPRPNAAMASPAPSPSLHMPPSPCPSPHLGSVRPCIKNQGSSRPSTPGPGTPHPGTPQPDPSHSGPPTPQPGTPRHWASPAPSPQPNAWPVGHAAYSPHVKHRESTGAYPDNMWSKTVESRCSTPLGLQENAWKSCGGSFAGSTPSPAPEGRLFPDALQQQSDQAWNPSRAESDVESTKGREEDDDEVWSDSEHNFLDPNIGGVAVAPAHGSILIECARRELHATTPLKTPDRSHPTRISLVFYQHKNLNQPMHGLAVWEAKMKLLAEKALQRQQEAALLGLSQEDIKALGKKRKWGTTAAGATSGPGQSKDKREGPATRLASTFYTSSTVTVSPYAFTRLTGPYNHFV